MANVSPLAVVERGAELADDARVGPFCYIAAHVSIGPGCVIENNVSITGRTIIGAKTRVFPLVAIGAPADGRDEQVRCEIGQANAIREHVTIYGGADAPTRIGNDNLIMIATTVGAGATIGDHGIIDNYSRIGPGAVIEDYVRTSGFASVERGVRVGAYSFVAGYASVTDDAPPYAMLQGSPVRVRGANVRNLKACGFTEQDVQALKAAFRELFDASGNGANPAALDALRSQDNLNPHVRRLLDACRATAEKADD